MEELQQYYEYLKGAGADVAPNFDSFQKTLQDEGTREKYYSYLKDSGYDTAPTYESFNKTFGFVKNELEEPAVEVEEPPVKKKEPTVSTSEPGSLEQPSFSYPETPVADEFPPVISEVWKNYLDIEAEYKPEDVEPGFWENVGKGLSILGKAAATYGDPAKATTFVPDVVPLFSKERTKSQQEVDIREAKINAIQEMHPATKAQLLNYAQENGYALDLESQSIAIDLKSIEKEVSQIDEIFKQFTENAFPYQSMDFKSLPQEQQQQLAILLGKRNALVELYDSRVGEYNKKVEGTQTFKKEIDLLKRQYGWLDNAVGGTVNMSKMLAAGTMELVAAPMEASAAAAAKTFPALEGVMEPIGDAGRALHEKGADIYNEASYADQNYRQPKKSVEDIRDAGDLGEWMSEQVFTQLPIYGTLLMTQGILPAAAPAWAQETVGAYILGSQTAGQKSIEMREEGTYTPSQIILASAGHGFFETFGEVFTAGIAAKGARAWRAALSSERKAAQRGVGEFFRKMGKGVGAANVEGLSEVGTQFGQNFIDIAVAGKDIHIWDGVKDAYAAGAFLGGAMVMTPTLAGEALRTFQKFDEQNKLYKNTREMISLEAMIAEGGKDEVVLKSMRKRSEALRAENEKILKESIQRAQMAPQEEWDKAIKADKKLAKERKILKQIQDAQKQNPAISDVIIEEQAEKVRQAELKRAQVLDDVNIAARDNIRKVAEESPFRGDPIKDLLYRQQRLIFDLTDQEAQSTTVAAYAMAETMAERSNKTVEEIVSSWEFQRAVVVPMGSKYQSSESKLNPSFSGVYRSNVQIGMDLIDDNSKMTIDQWTAAIANKGGKNTSKELSFMGLGEALKKIYPTAAEKNSSLTKQQVQEVVDLYRIAVSERRFGHNLPAILSPEQQIQIDEATSSIEEEEKKLDTIREVQGKNSDALLIEIKKIVEEGRKWVEKTGYTEEGEPLEVFIEDQESFYKELMGGIPEALKIWEEFLEISLDYSFISEENAQYLRKEWLEPFQKEVRDRESTVPFNKERSKPIDYVRHLEFVNTELSEYLEDLIITIQNQLSFKYSEAFLDTLSRRFKEEALALLEGLNDHRGRASNLFTLSETSKAERLKQAGRRENQLLYNLESLENLIEDGSQMGLDDFSRNAGDVVDRLKYLFGKQDVYADKNHLFNYNISSFTDVWQEIRDGINHADLIRKTILHHQKTIDGINRQIRNSSPYYQQYSQPESKREDNRETYQELLIVFDPLTNKTITERVWYDAEKDKFVAPHFWERNDGSSNNIVVHARFTEREMPDGKRALHIEEIQSDWGKKIVSHGSRSPQQLEANRKLFDVHVKEYEEAKKKGVELFNKRLRLTIEQNKTKEGLIDNLREVENALVKIAESVDESLAEIFGDVRLSLDIENAEIVVKSIQNYNEEGKPLDYLWDIANQARKEGRFTEEEYQKVEDILSSEKLEKAEEDLKKWVEADREINKVIKELQVKYEKTKARIYETLSVDYSQLDEITYELLKRKGAPINEETMTLLEELKQWGYRSDTYVIPLLNLPPTAIGEENGVLEYVGDVFTGEEKGDNPWKNEELYNSLMARRLIYEAIHRGLDYIVWSDGERQLKMYNRALQAVIKGIDSNPAEKTDIMTASKYSPISKSVRAKTNRVLYVQGTHPGDMGVDKDGKVIWGTDDLSGYVGYNASDLFGGMTNMILPEDDSPVSLSGTEITVDRNNKLKRLYNRDIPRQLQEELKRYDKSIKIGPVEINQTGELSLDMDAFFEATKEETHRLELLWKQGVDLEIERKNLHEKFFIENGIPEGVILDFKRLMGFSGTTPALDNMMVTEIVLDTNFWTGVDSDPQDMLEGMFNAEKDNKGITQIDSFESFKENLILFSNLAPEFSRKNRELSDKLDEIEQEKNRLEQKRDQIKKQISTTATIQQLGFPITPELRMTFHDGVTLFQENQGALYAEKGKYIIYALTNPNVSTPLHELAHIYEDFLTDEERKAVLDWAGHKKWTVETSEAFARGFEKYLSEGKAPTPELKGAFENFKKWLWNIYKGIEGSAIDVQLNDAMREIYGKMLGSNLKEKIKEVSKGKIEKLEEAESLALLSEDNDPEPEPEKKKGVLEKLDKRLEDIEKRLDQFSKESLGMNLPVAVASVVIKAMRGAIKTARSIGDITRIGLDALRETEWYKNLNPNNKKAAEDKVIEMIGEQPTMDPSIEEVGPLFGKTSERRSVKFPYTKKKVYVGGKVDEALVWLNQKYVDKYYFLRLIQRKITEDLGGYLPETWDFSRSEDLIHGKIDYRANKFFEKVQDIWERMAKKEVDPNDVDLYLIVQHGKERNKYIRERDEKRKKKDPKVVVNESGSGFTDKAIDTMAEELNALPNLADIKAFAQEFYDIIEETRQNYENDGLETKKNVQRLRDAYDNYVPLQGFADPGLMEGMRMDASTKLPISRSPVKKSKGRTTLPYSPSMNIVKQHINSITMGERNKVMNTIYQLIKNNPDSTIWNIYHQPKGDLARKIAANLAGKQDRYVPLRVNGKQVYLEFAAPHIARAINRSSAKRANVIFKWTNAISRHLSRVFTQWNPEFVGSNFTRDIQTAVVNILSEMDTSSGTLKEIKGKRIKRALVKEIVFSTIGNMWGLMNIEWGRGKKVDPELVRWYEEFKQEGAQTAWFYPKSVEGMKEDFEKAYRKVSKKSTGKDKADAVKEFLKLAVEGTNTAVENGVRLATYTALRKRGVSKMDAADVAKNLTVNFNRSGEFGPVANAAYLFFNAAVQGTSRMTRAVFNVKRVQQEDGDYIYKLTAAQKVIAGLATFNYLIAMFNMAWSADDEDGVSFYDKIPDYVKERNMIFMIPNDPNGEYIKVPMPYGYNIFANFATAIADVTHGDNPEKGLGWATSFMLGSILNSFMPINLNSSEKGVMASVLKNATPTVFKPIVEIALNENYFAAPIFREEMYGETSPTSYMGRQSSPEWLRDFFEFLNDATGGTEYIKGDVDINPDVIAYLFGYFAGGTGRFLGNTTRTSIDLYDKFIEGQPIDIEAGGVPGKRLFYGEPVKYVNDAMFYDRKDLVQQWYNELIKGEGQKVPVSRSEAFKLYGNMKATEEILKVYRDERRRIYKMENGMQKTEKMNAWEKKYYKQIAKFNKLWEQIVNERD